jgi:hypothetical protein
MDLLLQSAHGRRIVGHEHQANLLQAAIGPENSRLPVRRISPHQTVLVNADSITSELNRWLGRLFDADHLDATIAALDAVGSDEALAYSRTEALEEQLGDLRRRRERLLDLAELEDLARDLASRLRSLAARIAQAEAELASVTAAQENVLDLRATLSQMTDIAGEVIGEEADQGSLRDFYVAIRLRVDYDPSTRIASATVTLDGDSGEVSLCPRGDIDASPTNCWYHTDPLLGHSTNTLGASGRLAR